MIRNITIQVASQDGSRVLSEFKWDTEAPLNPDLLGFIISDSHNRLRSLESHASPPIDNDSYLNALLEGIQREKGGTQNVLSPSFPEKTYKKSTNQP